MLLCGSEPCFCPMEMMDFAISDLILQNSHSLAFCVGFYLRRHRHATRISSLERRK